MVKLVVCQLGRPLDMAASTLRQPVESPDQRHVTGSATVGRGSKTLATVQDARSLVLVDDFAARLPQRVESQGKDLVRILH